MKLTLIVGSHDRRSWHFPPKMYYYVSPTLRSETTLPLKKKKTKKNATTCCKHLWQRQKDWKSGRKVAYFCNFLKRQEHEKFKDWYNVKEESLFCLSLTFWKLCYVYFDHTKSCCKRLRQTSKIEKFFFGWCYCFRAYRLITTQCNVRRIVPCKR